MTARPSAWLGSVMAGHSVPSNPPVRVVTPPTHNTSGLVITQTFFVPTKDGNSHYELQSKPVGSATLVPTIFITRDRALYAQALEFEASGAPVAVAWHHATREQHGRVKVATRLTADPIHEVP